jgi:pimeloyl-ACP methyl ester carboxylesterase
VSSRRVEPVDLGVCPGYVYDGDPARTAIALPGARLGGMPAVWYAFARLYDEGWRIVLVWDEFRDRSRDPGDWARRRAEAAAEFAGGVRLLIAKSLTTYAAPLAADFDWPAVWLTPLFGDETTPDLRRRTAPALFVGGTADPVWDGDLARELSPDVLELDGADHGLARIDQAQQIADAVAAFSGRLGT